MLMLYIVIALVGVAVAAWYCMSWYNALMCRMIDVRGTRFQTKYSLTTFF
eukprot:m.6036 g.6036  ORF g.6036 m.6036 type:complete len:50 (-) comp2534_c0_seq1:48-197(-)